MKKRTAKLALKVLRKLVGQNEHEGNMLIQALTDIQSRMYADTNYKKSEAFQKLLDYMTTRKPTKIKRKKADKTRDDNKSVTVVS